MCQGCFSGCCTMPVEVKISDLIRLEVVTQDESEGSLKKVVKRLQKEGIISSYRHGTGLFMLTQRKGRDCIFLDEKLRICTVYNQRPEVCRQFPSIGPRPGYCPGFKY